MFFLAFRFQLTFGAFRSFMNPYNRIQHHCEIVFATWFPCG